MEETCTKESSISLTEPGVVDSLRNELIMDYTSDFTTHQYFESREHLISWVRSVANQLGMVIVVKRSNTGSTCKPRVMLACERSGEYRAAKTKTLSGIRNNADVEDVIEDREKMKKKRNTGTKKCSCPFLLRGKQVSGYEWELKVECGVHNHPVALDLTGHPYVGRFTKVEERFVLGMCEGNSRPKDILHMVKKTFKDNKSTIKTLYNFRSSNRVIERGGKSEMQYLMSKVQEHDYICYFRRFEKTDTVRDIFFAHPTSVKLLCAFPKVLLMDCTYKTNKYKLPLLEIVGVTSTGMTFQVACAYLEKEREENYLWACSKVKSLMNQSHLPNVIITDREIALMNAIEACFPTSTPLLCRWHISRNILANCKKIFHTKEKWDSFNYSWNVLILADSEIAFNELLTKFQVDFADYRPAVEYAIKHWIEPYKERFASAWTNNVMHFNNSTTNRAESHHSVLKKQLGSSMGNFETCWAKIHTLVEMTHTAIQASFETSINIVQHRFKSNLLKELRGMVSIDVLDKILDEIKIVPKGGLDHFMCGCVLRKTCGLPCAHEIFEFIRDGRPIPLDKVDGFWRKLDMKPNVEVDNSVIADLDSHILDAWDVVKSRFDEANEAEKRMLLRGMRELGNFGTTTLLAPEGLVTTRGRPSKRKGNKVEQSTKRDLSAFEYANYKDDILVEGSQRSCDALAFSKYPTMRKPISKRPRTRTLSSPSTLHLPPSNLQNYIVDTKNVLADGHCGFRVIAAHMRGSEDSYTTIRADLMQELGRHTQLYNKVFCESGRSDVVMEQLNCFSSCAPKKQWFCLPDMGYLIANYYNVALVTLTPKQCLTFFPLTKEIPSNLKCIAMALVGGDHFIQVFLRECHPLPPVAITWYRYRQDCAIGWEIAYKAQIDMYQVTGSSDNIAPTHYTLD